MRQTLSNLKTQFYRKPAAEVLRCVRWGPKAYFRCAAWAKQMEDSVKHLPRLTDHVAEPVHCWFLTGFRFWFQTAYCAWTLSKRSQRDLVVNLVDDGTLTKEQESRLRRLFPSGITVDASTTNEAINDLLPTSRFPILRARWGDYIHIRKLINVHMGSKGVKLVLDSDMLFFSNPRELMKWVDQPRGMCVMTDCMESYGYSRPLMETLCGATIPPKLNVGICGLGSDSIDWDQLEAWCERLHAQEGTSYYLEQALVAMLAARADQVTVMPEAEYITFPTQQQVKARAGVLQHYVADSKPWYFETAWKEASRDVS